MASVTIQKQYLLSLSLEEAQMLYDLHHSIDLVDEAKESLFAGIIEELEHTGLALPNDIAVNAYITG